MQPAESLLRQDATGASGMSSTVRRSLRQSEVRAVLVVVADVIREQPFQLRFIYRDNMVQQVPPAASDPALGNPVLPRALDRSLHARHVHGTNSSGNLQPVFRVSVEDQKSERRLEWKCFPQLLDDPTARRVLREVEVQDPPAIMADHEEAMEDAEGDRRDREEIHRRDGFPMTWKT